MGPVECEQSGTALVSYGETSSTGATAGAGGEVERRGRATSVFTALYSYADVVNATMHDAEAALRMRLIGGAPRPAHAHPLLLAPLLLAARPPPLH
jgi:hypothetical protein